MFTENEFRDCRLMMYARSSNARDKADITCPYESSIAADSIKPGVYEELCDKYKDRVDILEYVDKLILLYN